MRASAFALLALAAVLAAPGSGRADDGEDGVRALEPAPPEEARKAIEVKRHRRKDGALVEEYRIGGRVYMVRITPKIGRPYVLYDRDGDGVLETRLPGNQKKIAPPMWILKRF